MYKRVLGKTWYLSLSIIDPLLFPGNLPSELVHGLPLLDGA